MGAVLIYVPIASPPRGAVWVIAMTILEPQAAEPHSPVSLSGFHIKQLELFPDVWSHDRSCRSPLVVSLFPRMPLCGSLWTLAWHCSPALIVAAASGVCSASSSHRGVSTFPGEMLSETKQNSCINRSSPVFVFMFTRFRHREEETSSWLTSWPALCSDSRPPPSPLSWRLLPPGGERCSLSLLVARTDERVEDKPFVNVSEELLCFRRYKCKHYLLTCILCSDKWTDNWRDLQIYHTGGATWTHLGGDIRRCILLADGAHQTGHINDVSLTLAEVRQGELQREQHLMTSHTFTPACMSVIRWQWRCDQNFTSRWWRHD